MFKKTFFLLILVGIFALSFAEFGFAGLETELLVDLSSSTDNVPYNQTQWYGFAANGGKGYCAIVTPSNGDSNLYAFDPNFNLVGSSKETGAAQEKIWYGQAAAGRIHLGAYGIYNPSTSYTIQVITAPYVKTITPTTGGAGTLVTLKGFGFGSTRGSSYVKFGTVIATSYSSWTNTQIKVNVPSGVASGVIQTVVYVASKASNPMNFTVSGVSSDGTMWRYDLGRTGVYPNGPTTLPLSLKWSYNSSSSPNPITYNDKVLVNGSNSSELKVLNSDTGILNFTLKGGGTLSTPAVANNIVYAGCADGKVYAWDINTGVLKWSYYIGTAADYPGSSPAVANGIVYVGLTSLPTKPNSRLYALDATTGVLKWSYLIGDAILTSPAIANNTVYITPENSKVIALDATTGAIKWSYASGAGKLTTPCLSNNTVYAVGIKSVNSTTAKVAVYTLDANTGVLKWSYLSGEVTVSGWSVLMSSSPAISGNLLYFGGLYSEVYALDITTQTLKWEYKSGAITNDYARSSPTLSNNIVYVASSNGKFYALDASTGILKWTYAMGTSHINSSAAVLNGKVYITSGADNQKVYCFGQ